MPKSLKNNLIPILLVLATLVFVMAAFSAPNRSRTDEPTINTLVADIKANNVKRVSVSSGGESVRVERRDITGAQQRIYTIGKADQTELTTLLHNYGLTDADLASFEYLIEAPSAWMQILPILAYLALPIGLVLVFMLLMRRAQSGTDQAFSFGRSRARRMSQETPVVTFSDVAGCDEAKQELVEVVDFLKAPEKFIQLGARIPKGVLLVGPPGSGKTLLAKAVAGEAGVPFFSLSGSEFVELFVGVGASRVRDLFDQAKKAAPCIVFIDEIDAVGRQRGAGLGGGNDEREQTLNQMLVEMDGFNTDTNVIIIAATNRPDILDPALLRPGRFDRRVTVDAPDVIGREAILKVHTRGKPISGDIDLKVIAKQTPGFTGADIENLVNEAAILAARAGRKEITQAELQEAIEKVAMGPARRSRLMSARDKEIVAYHEAGHAIAMVMIPEAEESVQKVTIVPRGMASGITWYTPNSEDTVANSGRKKLEGRIATMMAGRAAEEIALDDITAGASGDMEHATSIARAMVRQYGMSDILGMVSFGDRQELVFLGREIQEGRSYSEKVAEVIDSEVSRIINQAYGRAKELLLRNRAKLDAVARALLERETLDGSEFLKVMEA
ncbi:MAG: ATP-dependent zinc metalloprotease FtsH [Thermoflexales bacterium]|nr:ATP-dependent zinc metalloprotease FtsH [Thermoflexales bacterium]